MNYKIISDQYLGQLKKMHEVTNFGANARRIKPHLHDLPYWIETSRSNSILDFGCGQGGVVRKLQKLYPEIAIEGYDPAVPNFNTWPDRTFDMVYSCDVLEHIEPHLLENVFALLNETFGKILYLNISWRPAVKNLPDGRNAHLIVEDHLWWKKKIQSELKDGKIVAETFLHKSQNYVVVWER